MRKAITHLKRNDPIMQGVISRVGSFRMEYRDPTFDTLVRSIVYQQVTGHVARVILGRLCDRLKDGCITPENILRLRTPSLRKVGLSGQKTKYIRDLAQHTTKGMLDFQLLPQSKDDEVIATLTKVNGIGVWTAQMFLMFALQRPDILPTGDLGIRKAMQREYNLSELPKPDVMEKLATPWQPYCSIASWYLWRSLDGSAAI